MKLIKLADIQEDSSYSGSQVNTDLPRQQVINSPEWETLKNFFTHFYGEFEFRRTWQNLCEYYEESDGMISILSTHLLFVEVYSSMDYSSELLRKMSKNWIVLVRWN